MAQFLAAPQQRPPLRSLGKDIAGPTINRKSSSQTEGMSDEENAANTGLPGANGGPQVLKSQEESLQEQELATYALGDILYIEGGVYDGSEGRLYYYDDEYIKILPNGLTNKLLTIPLDDEEYEELGIEEIIRKKRAVEPGFLSLVGFVKGEGVETFTTSGEPGPTFTVVDMNKKEDSILLRSELGDEMEILFNTESYQGIPRDLPFEVMRAREAPVASVKGSVDVLEELADLEGEGAKEEAAAALGDTNTEGEEEGEEEGEGEEGEGAAGVPVVLEVLEEFEDEAEGVLKEIPAIARTYPDAIQVTEMLTQMLQRLSAEQQKNPQRVKALSRKVEMFINLRNEVVRYGLAGEPRGLYSTSLQTLADLVAQPNIPLSRKIVDMTKVLYIDHTAEEYKARIMGLSSVDPVGEKEETLEFQFLEDVVKHAEALDAEMRAPRGAAAAEEPVVGLPRFYLDMERYRQQIITPYRTTIEEEEGGRPVQQDEEVFRSEPPAGPEDEPAVPALVQSDLVVYKPATEKIAYSIVRLLKSRQARFLNRESGAAIRTVEAGEIVAPDTVLLFPRSTLRELGPIRSGQLAIDMSLGSKPPRLFSDILAELGEASEFLTADGLLTIGLRGGILGGVSIKDWLESSKLPLTGHGDALLYLRPYGISTLEFNLDQSEVLNTKILQTLAALRAFLTEKRQQGKQFLESLRFIPAGLLAPAEQVRLLERIQAEPLLRELYDRAAEEFGAEIAEIDVYWVSYLYKHQPDLLLAVLGQQPSIVAKERLRAVRDQYLRALSIADQRRRKEKAAGELPQLNRCPHVAELEKIRKIKDDAIRQNLLVTKILSDFRGRIEKHWIECNNCDKHLICEHELYQVRQFLEPRNKDILEKEMVLAFSGGVFHGKYICKNCGQPMRDLDFDTHIEFNDSGQPMMGRSVMVDEEAIRAAELDALFTPSGVAEDIEDSRLQFGSDEANLVYSILTQMTDRMGIAPDKKDYESIVTSTSSYLSKLYTRKQYAAITRAQGKAAIDYDVYRARFTIAGTAASLLLNIQTRKPDYIIRYTNEECRAGFFGYPLEGEANKTGLDCTASTLASFMRDELPWNQTGFQKESNFQKRKALWLRLLESRIEETVKDPMVQVALKEKRQYLADLYGGTGGDMADQIPKSFRPVPLLLTAEEAAATSITPEAADPAHASQAWIRQAHAIARESAILDPNIPYAETTCCFHPLTNPDEFWSQKEMVPLSAKTIQIATRQTSFSMPAKTAKYTELEGEIGDTSLYSLFTRVCYDGPRKGLPHELGLTLRCRWCNLQFPEHPSMPAAAAPFSTDRKTEKRLMEEYVDELRAKQESLRTALTSQGAIINTETFQDVLDNSHLNYQVDIPQRKRLPRSDTTFAQLLAVPETPFEGWALLFEGCASAVLALGPTPTELQIAKACEPLIERVGRMEEIIQRRLGAKHFAQVMKLTRLSPQDLGETLTTYFIVPLTRWLTGVNGTAFPILKSYELEDNLLEGIKKGLEPHFRPLAAGVELVGLMRAKVEKLIKQYSTMKKQVCDILRIILTPGGRQMVTYIHRAFLMGPLHSYLDPQDIPDAAGDIAEGARAGARIKDLYVAISQLVDRIRDEGLNYSDEQIRILLEERREKEKMLFIKKQDKMTKEEQQLERMNKRRGLGDYAVTLKQVRYLDEEQQEREREQRALAGIVDYVDPTQGRDYDMLGFNYAAEYEAEGGYDNAQYGDDDDYANPGAITC
jgi:hypothetical protein